LHFSISTALLPNQQAVLLLVPRHNIDATLIFFKNNSFGFISHDADHWPNPCDGAGSFHLSGSVS
jgi:hypothetical protein